MTFSLLAVSPGSGEIGFAMATSTPAVGGWCAEIARGRAAVTVQACGGDRLRQLPRELLESGSSPSQVLDELRERDPHLALRRIAILDMAGGDSTEWAVKKSWAENREPASSVAEVLEPKPHSSDDRLPVTGSLTEASSGRNSLLFSNGSIYTVDPARPWVQAVVVRDGRIVHAGTLAEAKEHIGTETEKVDLEGGMLLPGFVDGHNHLISGPPIIAGLALDAMKSADEILGAIGSYAESHPELRVIRGHGFTSQAFGEPPRREWLDRVTGDVPAMFLTYDAHNAWFNSAALRQADITAETPDPVPGFAEFVRESDGTPTGFVLEKEAWGIVAERLGVMRPGREFALEGIELGLMQAPSRGITAYYDAGIFNGTGAKNVDAAEIYELLLNLELPVRVVASLWTRDPDDEPAELVDTLRDWRDRFQSERLRVNVLKVFLDGTIQSRTGHLVSPYSDDPGNTGPLVFPPERLEEALRAVHEAGLDAHMHADGDGAVRVALDAVEAVQGTLGSTESRYSIAHLGLVSELDIPRFAQLGVVANGTPVWGTDYNGSTREFEQLCGPDRVICPYGSLVRSGATVTFGSDIPGSKLSELSPLVQIQAALTRQRPGFPDDAPMPPAHERLALADAIRCYTCNSAFGLHMEDEIGTIEVGKRADLVVLDGDVFQVPVDNIASVGVRATMLDGELAYGELS